MTAVQSNDQRKGPREVTVRLNHAVAVFRVWEGQPELLLDNGSGDGPYFVVGRAELEKVAQQIAQLLAKVEDAPPPSCSHANKVEQHFTYGYQWHCPDCKASGEDWWD